MPTLSVPDLPPHFIAFVTDISARKETEQALIKAQAAEAATPAKSVFLANRSHEIRTPMNAILGMAHMIRRGALTAQQRSQFDQIDVSAQHLLAVINDILDLPSAHKAPWMRCALRPFACLTTWNGSSTPAFHAGCSTG